MASLALAIIQLRIAGHMMAPPKEKKLQPIRMPPSQRLVLRNPMIITPLRNKLHEVTMPAPIPQAPIMLTSASRLARLSFLSLDPDSLAAELSPDELSSLDEEPASLEDELSSLDEEPASLEDELSSLEEELSVDEESL